MSIPNSQSISSSIKSWILGKTSVVTSCCLVAKSCLTLRSHGQQYARFPCPSSSPGVCSNSYPLSWWCYTTIIPFSSCPQSFPASGSFPMSWLFTSGGQSIGTSASVSVLPMNIQGWFPLGLTGLISLQSKGFSRIFSSTTIQKHQLFHTQHFCGPSLTFVHDYWKNHSFDYKDLCWQSDSSVHFFKNRKLVFSNLTKFYRLPSKLL